MEFQQVEKRQTLAQQVCDQIKSSILNGQLRPGEAIPTEPELARQFGVSRAVVRDAARLLMAQGLLDIRHGKGMFVTFSQERAFLDSLVTALKRDQATVWDVEQAERILYPELLALAAVRATEQDIKELEALAQEHNRVFARLTRLAYGRKQPLTDGEKEQIRETFRAFMKRICGICENKLLRLFTGTLQNMRNLRDWGDSPGSDGEQVIRLESRYTNLLVELVASGDADKARRAVREITELPPQAVAAMKATPLGEVVKIPLTMADYRAFARSKTGTSLYTLFFGTRGQA